VPIPGHRDLVMRSPGRCAPLGAGKGRRADCGGMRGGRIIWNAFWAHARVSALQDRGCPSGPTCAPNPLWNFTGEDEGQEGGRPARCQPCEAASARPAPARAPWGCQASWLAPPLLFVLFVPLSGERHHTEHNGFEGRRALVMRSPGRAPKSIPTDPPATHPPTVSSPTPYRPPRCAPSG